MSDVGGPPVDSGRQPERTWLAWRRTTLAMTVATVLAVRLALASGTVGAVVAVVWLIGWIGLMLLVRPWRAGPPRHWTATGTAGSRSAAPDRFAASGATPRPSLPPRQALPLAAAVTVVQAGLGVLLVLTTLG